MKCQKWKAKAEELQQVAEKKRYESPLQLAERSIQTTVKVYNTAYFPWWWDSNTWKTWDSRWVCKSLWPPTQHIKRGWSYWLGYYCTLAKHLFPWLKKPEFKELLDAINATNEVGATPLCDTLDILSNLCHKREVLCYSTWWLQVDRSSTG